MILDLDKLKDLVINAHHYHNQSKIYPALFFDDERKEFRSILFWFDLLLGKLDSQIITPAEAHENIRKFLAHREAMLLQSDYDCTRDSHEIRKNFILNLTTLVATSKEIEDPLDGSMVVVKEPISRVLLPDKTKVVPEYYDPDALHIDEHLHTHTEVISPYLPADISKPRQLKRSLRIADKRLLDLDKIFEHAIKNPHIFNELAEEDPRSQDDAIIGCGKILVDKLELTAENFTELTKNWSHNFTYVFDNSLGSLYFVNKLTRTDEIVMAQPDFNVSIASLKNHFSNNYESMSEIDHVAFSKVIIHSLPISLTRTELNFIREEFPLFYNNINTLINIPPIPRNCAYVALDDFGQFSWHLCGNFPSMYILDKQAKKLYFAEKYQQICNLLASIDKENLPSNWPSKPEPMIDEQEKTIAQLSGHSTREGFVFILSSLMQAVRDASKLGRGSENQAEFNEEGRQRLQQFYDYWVSLCAAVRDEYGNLELEHYSSKRTLKDNLILIFSINGNWKDIAREFGTTIEDIENISREKKRHPLFIYPCMEEMYKRLVKLRRTLVGYYELFEEKEASSAFRIKLIEEKEASSAFRIKLNQQLAIYRDGYAFAWVERFSPPQNLELDTIYVTKAADASTLVCKLKCKSRGVVVLSSIKASEIGLVNLDFFENGNSLQAHKDKLLATLRSNGFIFSDNRWAGKIKLKLSEQDKNLLLFTRLTYFISCENWALEKELITLAATIKNEQSENDALYSFIRLLFEFYSNIIPYEDVSVIMGRLDELSCPEARRAWIFEPYSKKIISYILHIESLDKLKPLDFIITLNDNVAKIQENDIEKIFSIIEKQIAVQQNLPRDDAYFQELNKFLVKFFECHKHDLDLNYIKIKKLLFQAENILISTPPLSKLFYDLIPKEKKIKFAMELFERSVTKRDHELKPYLNIINELIKDDTITTFLEAFIEKTAGFPSKGAAAHNKKEFLQHVLWYIENFFIEKITEIDADGASLIISFINKKLSVNNALEILTLLHEFSTMPLLPDKKLTNPLWGKYALKLIENERDYHFFITHVKPICNPMKLLTNVYFHRHYDSTGKTYKKSNNSFYLPFVSSLVQENTFKMDMKLAVQQYFEIAGKNDDPLELRKRMKFIENFLVYLEYKNQVNALDLLTFLLEKPNLDQIDTPKKLFYSDLTSILIENLKEKNKIGLYIVADNLKNQSSEISNIHFKAIPKPLPKPLLNMSRLFLFKTPEKKENFWLTTESRYQKPTETSFLLSVTKPIWKAGKATKKLVQPISQHEIGRFFTQPFRGLRNFLTGLGCVTFSIPVLLTGLFAAGENNSLFFLKEAFRRFFELTIGGTLLAAFGLAQIGSVLPMAILGLPRLALPLIKTKQTNLHSDKVKAVATVVKKVFDCEPGEKLTTGEMLAIDELTRQIKKATQRDCLPLEIEALKKMSFFKDLGACSVDEKATMKKALDYLEKLDNCRRFY